jgi:two-component system, OmpR family, sensor histidine kinase BaeS
MRLHNASTISNDNAMKYMRLRLVHTLSLILVVTVLLAVLAMGAVTAWNLKSGFTDYLAARDVERLEQFAALTSEIIVQSGGLAALQQRSPDMRELLELYAQRQGLPARRARPPREEPAPVSDVTSSVGRPPGGPGGPGGADGFGPRVTVVSVDGNPIFDRPRRLSPGPFIERPIRVRGETVALARLREGGRVPDAVDARFLQKQYLGIVGVSVFLVLLALASAWWVARRWVRPLQSVQHATSRIAHGAFDVRVEVSPGEARRSDEIGDLVRNINQMAEGLQRLERARRRWMADISHELRTPLAVLRGEIDALVDGVRPLQPEAMLSLREEVLHLGSLVDDLHLLAMSDLDALPCHFDEVDAIVVMRQLVLRFEGRAKVAGLSLSLNQSAISALPVHWDRTRVDQLLDNLLENTLRYTDAPGYVELTVKQDDDQVVITLDDSAPGVSVADLGHLFEPLYRADVARSRHRGGSGLGLAICEAIVRSHGGHIEAKLSALGGLQIYIELPISAGASA